ncbi:MAG: acetyl-CoA acetyltransferase, partial [Gammaproteobacteria bacterium]|nr:acetyl-CoA acetyltransferase [Gammaproteobacteria bacterium]
AIAEMVERIRADPDTRGIVVANGGYLSKHSVGIYSGHLQSPWRSMSSAAEQRRAKAGDSVKVVEEMAGRGRIESYAAIYRRGVPASGFIVGRREDDDARFLALVKPGDATALDVLFRDEVIGTAVTVSNAEGLNYFELAQ